MAKSPYGAYGGGGSPRSVSAVKAKAHATLNGTNGTSSKKSAASDRVASDLDQQLNQETRKKYFKDKRLGEGTYAVVYRGHLKSNPSRVFAIKKMKANTEYKDGLTMDGIREAKALQELVHPNIIALHDVYLAKYGTMCLALEYLPLGDLKTLIVSTTEVHYGPADIKAWMGMLGRAIWFCHENFVLHRDIKPENLLVAADGNLKLADFGLARAFAEPYAPMTHNVITRWYRPPELFYGAKFYSGAVDMWSVAGIFAELILRVPFIQGMNELESLSILCRAVGTPTEENWPGVSKLPAFVPPAEVTPVPPRAQWMRMFGSAGSAGVDLLMSLYKLDPRKRMTAKGMLQHEWWSTEPRPSRPQDLPKRAGGEEKMGENLTKKGGELQESSRADGVARKLDFSKMK